MSQLKIPLENTASAEFQNEMAAGKASGLSHDQAYLRALRKNSGGVKKMHRAPLVGLARISLRSKLHTGFLNADDEFFPGLVKSMSEPLQKMLCISADSSPDIIRNALSARLSGMPSTAIAQVWAAVIAYLTSKNPTRNASIATDDARKMFPALADAAGC